MTNYGPTVGLVLLLHHLETDQFKPLPAHVGLKTVNVAEQAGFVKLSRHITISAKGFAGPTAWVEPERVPQIVGHQCPHLEALATTGNGAIVEPPPPSPINPALSPGLFLSRFRISAISSGRMCMPAAWAASRRACQGRTLGPVALRAWAPLHPLVLQVAFFDKDRSKVPPNPCKSTVAIIIEMDGLMKPANGKQEGSDINYVLGKRIRTVRKSLGLSQTHIAKSLGVSFQQVGKYESGQNTMSVQTFMTICRALRLKPSSLLDEYLGRES
jgi:DNA-binding XRE family transcriptional regulator